MKYRIGVTVEVVLLLGILAAGCGNSSTRTTSPTTTDLSAINSASSKSSNGLSLVLSLNSTTYRSGQDVRIVVDETNTQLQTNNVPISNNWPYGHLHVAFCDFISPFGLAVFYGYYTSYFPTATQLTFYDPNITQLCTTNIAPTIYSFQPSSDIANVIGNSNLSPIKNGQQMKYEITTKGSWPKGTNSRFTNFTPGTYTVIAGDEWGSLIILHFTVSK